MSKNCENLHEKHENSSTSGATCPTPSRQRTLPAAKALARSTGLEPVTSGVTVDDYVRPAPSTWCQTQANSQVLTDTFRADGRSGRPGTRKFRPYLAPTRRGGLWLHTVEMSEVLTVPEVARELRVSRSTVYALCESGELKCFRVGNAIRVLRKELEAYRADETNS